MKYFPYSLIASANDWIDQSDAERLEADTRFWRGVDGYHEELDLLQGRISKKAWQFFRYGTDEHGLHDGRLLRLCVGDGLDFVADGSTPFRRNRTRGSARVEFLNFEQRYHYVFEMRGVRRFAANCELSEQRFGDLYLLELTAVDAEALQLGFVFAEGAELELAFRKLIFRKRRITKSYDELLEWC